MTIDEPPTGPIAVAPSSDPAERLGPAARYGTAAVLMLVALVAATALRDADAPTVFAPILLALAATVWLFGDGPALVVAVAAAIATQVVVLSPRGSWRIERATDMWGWIAYIIAAAVIVALGRGMRIARARAERNWHEAETLYVEQTSVSRRLAGLQRVTAAVAGELTLGGVADAAIREGMTVLGAQAGVIASIDGTRLHLIAHRGYDASITERWRGVTITTPLPGPEAARTGRIVMLGSMEEAATRFPALAAAGPSTPHQALVAAPLSDRGASHGFLGFGFDRPRTFSPGDAALLTAIAQLTTVALTRARAFEVERDANRSLQRSLLPSRLPQVDGLTVATRYRPLGDGTVIGGDFYDVQVVGREVVLMMGDVCGKGIEAAALTALSRHTLRALTAPGVSAEDLVRRLNDVVHREQQGVVAFLTAAVARLTPAGGGWDLEVCCAGHPMPMVADAGGPVREVGHPGSLIGIDADVNVRAAVTRLTPGSTLLMYTDGLSEARRHGELFGEARIAQCVDRHRDDPERLLADLEHDVVVHRRGPLQDDLAMLAVRVDPRT